MSKTRDAGPVELTGLVLKFDGRAFRIEIVDADGVTFLSLGPFAEEDVVATWRSIAASSGLLLLASGPDGRLDPIYPQLGRVVMGERRDGRRLAVLAGRRPRFLVKRKPARLPRRPRVHRERELVAGRAR